MDIAKMKRKKEWKRKWVFHQETAEQVDAFLSKLSIQETNYMEHMEFAQKEPYQELPFFLLTHSFNDLCYIVLDNNSISNIAGIERLGGLKSLSLMSNRMTTESIMNVSLPRNLESLNLCKNFITEIPSSLSVLTKLKTLSLQYNKIECVPDYMTALQLLTLNLNDNPIKKFPLEVFSQMPSLQYVNLERTNMSRIPCTVTQLTHLKTLHSRWVSEGTIFLL